MYRRVNGAAGPRSLMAILASCHALFVVIVILPESQGHAGLNIFLRWPVSSCSLLHLRRQVGSAASSQISRSQVVSILLHRSYSNKNFLRRHDHLPDYGFSAVRVLGQHADSSRSLLSAVNHRLEGQPGVPRCGPCHADTPAARSHFCRRNHPDRNRRHRHQ